MIASKEVPAVRTPLSHEQLRRALVEGHRACCDGDDPPRNLLRFAWAQVCLETGGGASGWCHNLGNIKTYARDRWTGLWYRLPRSVQAKAPKEWPAQRGYETAEQGARDYWALLFRRYRSALARADVGDLEGAARELRGRGYFEAPLAAYAAAMLRWAEQYDREWPEAQPIVDEQTDPAASDDPYNDG